MIGLLENFVNSTLIAYSTAYIHRNSNPIDCIEIADSCHNSNQLR